MEDKYFTVKEVSLSNRCPECYSNEGLRLTFRQKFVETFFYRAIVKDIKQTLVCHTCNTEIFPIRWTDDMERIFEYHQRAFIPKSATLQLKKKTWIILVVTILLIVLLNIYLLKI